MDDYLTEEERLDAVKRWWKENGRSVFLGLGLGAAIVVGWNVWQTKQRQRSEQASTAFQQLLKADQTKQPDAALKLSERLMEQYGSTTYGLYGKLFAAKFKTERGDLIGAKQLLQDIVTNAGDENFRHLARLRLGQVMLSLHEEEAALKMIESMDAKAAGQYQGLYAELRGDLLVALGRADEARTAYEQAQQLGEMSPLLELKLEDLASAPAKS